MIFETKILDLLKAKSLSVGSWAVILALVTAVVRLTQPDATTHFALAADLFTLPAIPWPCRMALLLIMVACAFSRSEPVQSAQVALLRVVNGCKVRNLHNAFSGGKCLKCHRVLLGAASLVPVHRVPFPTVSRVLLVVLALKKSIPPPDELKAAVGLKTILSDNSLWWILLLILECVYVLFNDGNKSWHSIVDNEDTSRLFLTRAPLRCSRPRVATIYCRKPSLLLQLVCGFGIPLFIEIYALSTYHSATEIRVSSLCQQMLCSSVLPIMFLLINSPQTPLLPNQRFLTSAALSSLWAAIRIASIHHATTSISFATSFWVLRSPMVLSLALYACWGRRPQCSIAILAIGSTRSGYGAPGRAQFGPLLQLSFQKPLHSTNHQRLDGSVVLQCEPKGCFSTITSFGKHRSFQGLPRRMG